MKNPLNVSLKQVSEMALNSSEGFAQGMDYFSEGIKNLSAILIEDPNQFSNFSAEVLSDPTVEIIRADGCRKTLLDKLERRCYDEFEKFVTQSQSIEDDVEKTGKICCAMVDYEKCSLRGYDKANCGADKNQVRDNIKSVTLFMSVISSVSCAEFRGRCAEISSATAISASWMALLPLGLMLLC
ncbi:hypothetical protein X975_03178, partial [Stegodyphus mimosarum]